MYIDDRILIVEDNLDQLRLMTEVLQSGRISNEVHSVTTGEEAIAFLSGESAYCDRTVYPLPCLLLLDLKLPRISGFEVLEWVRAHPVFRTLPVVVLTGSHDSEDIERAYQLGANSYLLKPFKMEELRAVVKSINAYWVILAQKPQN